MFNLPKIYLHEWLKSFIKGWKVSSKKQNIVLFGTLSIYSSEGIASSKVTQSDFQFKFCWQWFSELFCEQFYEEDCFWIPDPVISSNSQNVPGDIPTYYLEALVSSEANCFTKCADTPKLFLLWIHFLIETYRGFHLVTRNICCYATSNFYLPTSTNPSSNTSFNAICLY